MRLFAIALAQHAWHHLASHCEPSNQHKTPRNNPQANMTRIKHHQSVFYLFRYYIFMHTNEEIQYIYKTALTIYIYILIYTSHCVLYKSNIYVTSMVCRKSCALHVNLFLLLNHSNAHSFHQPTKGFAEDPFDKTNVIY